MQKGLPEFLKDAESKSGAKIPQLAISKILKHIEEMDCVEIPMTHSTYRGKHEVKR